MGIFINNEDFTGRYSLPQNALMNDFVDEYIEKYEEKYLQELMGVEMYNDFISTLGYPSQTEEYAYIEDAFVYNVESKIIRSEGIKEMLKGFLYFHIVRDFKFKNSVTGISISTSEISTEANFDTANIYGRYNDAVKTYDAIQYHCIKNASEYQLFKGIKKTVVHWSL